MAGPAPKSIMDFTDQELTTVPNNLKSREVGDFTAAANMEIARRSELAKKSGQKAIEDQKKKLIETGGNGILTGTSSILGGLT